jgi:uncharacterized protein (UPF0276 family)
MTSTILMAAGFNPGILDSSVLLPRDVAALEVGVAALPALRTASGAEGRRLSLHLSRAPMCDPIEEQELFLARVATFMGSDIQSVGVHLCGPLRDGMGRLGLGSGFSPTRENRARACRFLERLREVAGVPVLVENANLYPVDDSEFVGVGVFLRELIEARGFGLILDLAHLEMAAHNVGASLDAALGTYPSAEVLHVSGYHRRGAWMHDGHDAAVAESTWMLLRQALSLSVCTQVVLEHTDPSWAARPEDLEREWARLRRELEQRQAPEAFEPRPPEGGRAAPDELAFAVGYLTRIVLPARFPSLVEALGTERFRALVRAWSTEFLSSSTGHRLPFVHDGALVADLADSVSVVQDFHGFALRWSRGALDAR